MNCRGTDPDSSESFTILQIKGTKSFKYFFSKMVGMGSSKQLLGADSQTSFRRNSCDTGSKLHSSLPAKECDMSVLTLIKKKRKKRTEVVKKFRFRNATGKTELLLFPSSSLVNPHSCLLELHFDSFSIKCLRLAERMTRFLHISLFYKYLFMDS